MTRPTVAAPLPMRRGVSASAVCLPAGSWPTLLDFFSDRFAIVPRDVWAQRMAQGDVVDETGRAWGPHQACSPGLKLFYYRALADEAPIPVRHRILFQDEVLLVADKPHFLPVVPTGRYLHETLLVRLKDQLGLPHLSPLHRIDRETAGLILFSVQPRYRGAYQDLFRQRKVHKEYEAVAPWRADISFPRVQACRLVEGGAPGEPFFKMRVVDGAPNSETEMKISEVRGTLARYSLLPRTGRKHQLRVHMASLGIPILNDLFYPSVRNAPNDPDDLHKPLQLLAKQLAFVDPVTGQMRSFQSQLQLSPLATAHQAR